MSNVRAAQREIEAKILDINPAEVQKLLRKNGAKLTKELDLRQVIWWVPKEKHTSIRVRKDSEGVVMLTMKKKVQTGLGYQEWQSQVTDYQAMVDVIDALMPRPDLRLEFSHHRQDWRLGKALININWFPKLSPLLEIESFSAADVKRVARLLGFGPEQLIDQGVATLLINKISAKKGERIRL